MATRDIAEQFLQRPAAADADGLGNLFAESIDWRVAGDDELVRLHLYEDTLAVSTAFRE